MPIGSQEGLNINEANVVRDGVRTIGREEVASSGDVIGFDSNGDLTVLQGGWLSCQTARVVLHSADILTMSSSPIQVLTAPAPGQIIVPFSLLYRSGAGTTPYDSFGGAYCHTPSNDLSCPSLVFMLASIPDPVTDADIDGGWQFGGGFDPVTPGPVSLTCDSDPQNGDFDIAVEIAYYTLTAAAAP